MHPFNIAYSLYTYGFWYTYWSLRNEFSCTRWQSLWLIWVGWNYESHKKKMFD
jgi:hypothetical protein